jgi:hypothetical protein
MAQQQKVTGPPLLPAPHWTLLISAEQNPVKMGSAVELRTVMKNSTDEDILIWAENGGDQCDIIAKDSVGNSAPETRRGARLHGHRFPDDKELIAGSGAYITIKAGEQREWVQDVSRLYDFNQPGKYTLQARKADAKSGRLVESNVITLTVTE